MSAIKKFKPDDAMSIRPKIKPLHEQPEELRQQFYKLGCEAIGEDAEPKAVQAFKQFVTEHPEMIEGLRFTSLSIESSLAALITGKDAVEQTFLEQETRELRTGLGYEEATEIERMMIDRVVMCWLRVLYAEGMLSYIRSQPTCSIRELEITERSLQLAHTRHIRAVEALARISKLVRSNRPTELQIRAAIELQRRRRARQES